MKTFQKTLFLALLCLSFSLPVLALEDDDVLDSFDAAAKARQAHEKAASDMMYQNEEWKAMYYQNQQIIQLLKEVRDTLNAIQTRVTVKDVEK